jgi:WS/DGAT/MGAT family acyltransferase
MRQLTGLDASFLYLETPNAPMHIASLGIYDQSTAPGGKVRFKEIIKNTHRRIIALPMMTQKLVTVPMSLDHPYWVTDGAFDPEFHIRHIALPKPGDWRQLCILIARLHSRPLDRGRPLWELYIIEGLNNIEGLPGGCFAMFSKTHHAVIDGQSSIEMTTATHDLSADYKQVHHPEAIEIDNHPSSLELFLKSQIHNIRKPFNFLSVVRKTVPGMARAATELARGQLHRVSDIPRTRFNGSVSPHRVFDAINVPLDDIKKIKNSIEGATVNDAAIAIVGGALRKYLQAHDELPVESLAAMAPINVRSGKDETGGNIVSSMTVQVRSDVAEPLERLRAVREGTRDAKELTQTMGAKAMTDYMQFIPPMLTPRAARLASRWHLMNRMTPQYNCVITNVPGPPVPLYSTGARLVASYGTGPVLDGMGLFHVISSYCGQFTISVTSCRVMMPDPSFYRQCLQDSFDEMLAAMENAGKPRRRTTHRKATDERPAREKVA